MKTLIIGLIAWMIGLALFAMPGGGGRPQPLVEQFYTAQQFQAASSAGKLHPQRFTFDPPMEASDSWCDWEPCGREIAFAINLSGVMFEMSPGTEICCEAGVGDNAYYCASEEGSGPVWGLGVSPVPKIKECVIYHGSVTAFWFY